MTISPRRNLDRCPSCSTHLTLASARDGVCPFCSADLRAASREQRRFRNAFRRGKSGLLAASLLGMTIGGAACSDEDPKPGPDATTTSGDATQSDGSAGTDVATSTSADVSTTTNMDTGGPDTGQTTAVPPYGIPADFIDPPTDVADADASDSAPSPAYGIPADME